MIAPIPPLPEPCLDAPCRSRIACDGWGYCRERNKDDNGCGATDAQQESRRNIARGRRIREAAESRRLGIFNEYHKPFGWRPDEEATP